MFQTEIVKNIRDQSFSITAIVTNRDNEEKKTEIMRLVVREKQREGRCWNHMYSAMICLVESERLRLTRSESRDMAASDSNQSMSVV